MQIASRSSVSIGRHPPPSSTMIANQPAAQTGRPCTSPAPSLLNPCRRVTLQGTSHAWTPRTTAVGDVSVVGHSAVTPLTILSVRPALQRCMISAALYTGSRSSASLSRPPPSTYTATGASHIRESPLDYCTTDCDLILAGQDHSS
jgi:hypothetical protein